MSILSIDGKSGASSTMIFLGTLVASNIIVCGMSDLISILLGISPLIVISSGTVPLMNISLGRSGPINLISSGIPKSLIVTGIFISSLS